MYCNKVPYRVIPGIYWASKMLQLSLAQQMLPVFTLICYSLCNFDAISFPCMQY
jgi:hypothetical protein